MAEDAKNTLQKFALHIQLSASECEDATAVAKRYLALHVNVVSTASAYANVADDFRVVELRTHTPTIKHYSSSLGNGINVNTFTYLMSTIPDETVARAKGMHAFSQFTDRFFPRPAGEERWRQISRPQQWREKAAFLALNLRGATNLPDVLKAIVGNERASEMIGPFRTYDLKQFRKDELLDDINTIIAQVNVPHHDMVILAKTQLPLAFEEEEEPTQKDGVKTTAPKVVASSIVEDGTLEDLRPGMEAYRKRAGLNATVSTLKIAKQMLFSALGTPVEHIPDGVLGTHQKALPAIVNDDELRTALDVLQMCKSIDIDVSESDYLLGLSAACKRKEWDSRVLLKYAIRPADSIEAYAYSRVLKKWPTCGRTDAAVINAIVNLK